MPYGGIAAPYGVLTAPYGALRALWGYCGALWLGILAKVLRVYFTLCSPRSGPRKIRDFWWGFLESILFYVVLRAGRAQFGIFSEVF